MSTLLREVAEAAPVFWLVVSVTEAVLLVVGGILMRIVERKNTELSREREVPLDDGWRVEGLTRREADAIIAMLGGVVQTAPNDARMWQAVHKDYRPQ